MTRSLKAVHSRSWTVHQRRDLPQDLVAVADDDVRQELEPARGAAREVERAPPQAAFGAFGHHPRKRGVVGFERRRDRRQAFRVGGKGIEG